MGRPINKNKIGQGAGRIKVSRHFFTGGSELTTNAWIVNQRSTYEFTVSDGVSTEVLTLVDKTGSLVAGEFTVNAVLDDSTVVQVTKLRNRTIQYDDATNIGYELEGVEGGDHTTDDNRASVETQS